MDYIEVTGKTVEDARTEALIKLGTTSDQIEVEILEKGSSGFLGIGSKPAVIRVRRKFTMEDCVRDFLTQVFDAMDLTVDISVEVEVDNHTVNVELKGDDMGILIGKRGQTLDSLQYLTSLALNRHTDEYVKVKLDTEDYRKRRKETLENLAKNIAYKVKRTRRSVSLEPMNPYERRIIHAAVQNDKYVTTRSEGEEPFRHVVIALKKEAVSGERKGRYDRAGRGRSYGYKGNNRRGGSYQTAPKAEPVTETVSESAQE